LRMAVCADGLMVVNTLRQFSWPELAAILAASLFSPARLRLALAILRRDYFSGTTIDGTLVARRYRRKELLALFRAEPGTSAAHYNGVLGTSLFAREITLVMSWRK